MSDEDDIYRYTTRKPNLWNSYRSMRTEYEVSENMIGSSKANSGHVLELIGEINSYMEQARSTQELVSDIGIHKAIKEQLAEGQTVKVFISEEGGKTDVDIYRGDQAVMRSAESDSRSFTVTRPGDICAINANETTEFKVPTDSGIVTERLGGDPPRETIRSEASPVPIPEVLREAIETAQRLEPKSDVPPEKEREQERESEEIRSTLP